MKLWIQILIGLFLGILAGVLIQYHVWPFHHFEITHLSSLGNIFIDLLKMVVGLIIFSSLVAGICHINDPKKLGRIGIRTFIFYAVTTLLAIGLGILFALVVKPGAHLSPPESVTIQAGQFSFMEFLYSIVPSNPFQSFSEGNILQIIVFAIFFAFGVTLSGSKGKPILAAIESLSEVMYSLTHVIMKLAPYGVFFLMAATVGQMGLKVVNNLMKFLLCNYIACILQVVIILCPILKYLARVAVIPFFKGMKDAMVLAMTTNSSSATLPVTLECVRDHLGVSNDISGFVVSLGSTINMNGAAIGQAISAIFIAQAYGIEITAMKVVILIFTALVSAIGAAGIPGTGLVMLTVVLNSMGLPIEGIALVAGVDRIREMISSVVNILGDAAAAVYVAKKENQIDLDQYHHVTWLE
ncbi:MAG: dicarboxylate/amino acid:cation symporter [Simkaniaceae bacterium]|nr:dicarboxylate/amino acid:cation symporter [Simkaniaceae bacterium]